MSESANGAARPIDDGERTRRRQSRVTARVLKEYTARVYRIAHHLGEYEDGRIPRSQIDLPPWSVYVAIHRFEAIRNELRAVALFASQVLVHYGLDEADASELRLRVADAEQAIFRAGNIVESLRKTDPDLAQRDSEPKPKTVKSLKKK